MIELSNIRIEKSEDKTNLVCDIRSNVFSEKTMWYSVPLQFGDFFVADVYDAFLVAILYPAMYYKEDIVVHGNISKKLFKNITTYVKKILLAYSNDITDINVKVEGYKKATKIHNFCGTGFSGGIDSFATFVEHYVNEEDDDYKINRLFFFNVGSHGSYYNSKTMDRFNNRYNMNKIFPESLGIPFIPVNSNIRAFHERFGHQKTHPLTLVSGILAVQSCLSKYYISSAISYFEMPNSIKTARNFDLAEFAEPYLYPLLSPEELDIIPDGEQYYRSEKTQLITSYEPTRKFLNVCVRNEDNYITSKNCSCCSKCLRTLMTLESIDMLSEFSNVFDIDVYRKYAFKYKCLQRVMYKKDPFAKDNVDFAKKNGKKIPLQFVAVIVEFPFLIKRMCIQLIRFLLGDQKYKKIKENLIK